MTPRVFVHGFMGGSAQWAAQAPLGPVVAVDLPGFGTRANMPPLGSIADYAAWTLAHLHSQGHDRFDLLGHSMGGMVVQEIVRQAPARVRRLVLYGTGPVGLLPGRFEPIETSIARAEAEGARSTARRIAATWFLDGAEAAGYPATAALAEASGAEAIRAGLEAMRDWSGVDALAGIAAPTLVLWGARDRTYPWAQPERLWRGIPGADLAVVPAAAHAVHAERPALFNLLIGEFFSG